MRQFFPRLLRLLKIAVLVGLVVGVVKAIRGRRPPEGTGEARWPPLAEEPAPAPRSGPVAFAETLADEPAANEAAWVEPVDGVCPVSHPVKGKAGSGIYHVPGGASYDRTVPERCYVSPEAAEADGFRRAKR